MGGYTSLPVIMMQSVHATPDRRLPSQLTLVLIAPTHEGMARLS